MSKRPIIPSGTRFGRLRVVGEDREKTKQTMICECECGNIVSVVLYSLRNGDTKSCGCLHREILSRARTTHGQTSLGVETPSYRLWCHIKSRAVTGTNTNAKRYAGRGISMYKPWVEDFAAFDTWVRENLGECPTGCSLDRINNDGHYEPGNIRWADKKSQANNRSNNIVVSLNGEALTIAQWAEKLNLSYACLWSRVVTHKWPAERALLTPVRGRRR